MKLFTTFCCAALLASSAIYAQSSADHMTVQFDTPVMVGETKLPAGKCDIQVMHGSSDTTILILRSKGTSVAALASHIQDDEVSNEETASLILNRKGNDLQLSRVFFGDRTGYQLSNVE
jgi:hypothetical protein